MRRAKPASRPLRLGHTVPRRNNSDLQSSTGSEGGYAGCKHRSHQIDFPPCLGRVLVEMKRRTGHEHRIIALKLCLVGQCSTSVRRFHPMANSLRCEKAQGLNICFPGASSHALATAFPGLRRFTFRHEETQLFWHRELSGLRSADGRDEETRQTILRLQPVFIASEVPQPSRASYCGIWRMHHQRLHGRETTRRRSGEARRGCPTNRLRRDRLGYHGGVLG
jgi:hypothetical protein